MDGGGLTNLTDSSDLWKDQTKTTTSSNEAISVLVVDDDITCLAIVSAILKKFNYEVATAKNPKDALCTLRIKGGAFDLVVSDVHMPDMNGFELQQAISQEFNLPVVLMSADDKECIALKGLECGAAFFIMKPVNPDDVRDLWQFAAMNRKENQYVNIEETSSENVVSDKVDMSASSSLTKTKESKRKSPRKEGSSEERNGENSQQKRPKVVWTNSLHNRFLEAIRSIGLDRAVPKKILEVMNVPGLTRENVASHLQKYRIFLRRVSDASYNIQYSSHKGLKSNCESSRNIASPSTLMFNKFSRHTHQNLEASSSSQLTSGPSLLSKIGSWQNPIIGSPTSRVTHAHDNYVAHTSMHGHLANITLDDVGSFDLPTSSLPPKKSNYVGYSISDIKSFVEKCGGPKSLRGVTNLSSDQLRSCNAVGLNDGALARHVDVDGGGETYPIPAEPDEGIADHRMHFGFGHGGEIEESILTPSFDLSEFDLSSAQQALEATLPNQNDHQSKQNNGDETNTSFNFYDSMANWQNCVNVPYSSDQPSNQLQYSQLTSSQGFAPSSQLNGAETLPTNENRGLMNSMEFGTFAHQLSKSVLSPSHERNDDDFLESLLAPFGEDHSLEGS